MEKNKINLTEQAQKQLDKFGEDQVDRLVKLIVSDKEYPGVDEIEITADDIRQFSRYIYFRRTDRRSRLVVLAWIYLVLGFFSSTLGIFWDKIGRMFIQSPFRLTLIASGIFLSMFSVVALITLYLNRGKMKPL